MSYKELKLKIEKSVWLEMSIEAEKKLREIQIKLDELENNPKHDDQ